MTVQVQQIYECLPELSEGAWRKRKQQLAAAATRVPTAAGSSWGQEQPKRLLQLRSADRCVHAQQASYMQ